ncbi:unnamed protein product [Prunus armeniaca]
MQRAYCCQMMGPWTIMGHNSTLFCELPETMEEHTILQHCWKWRCNSIFKPAYKRSHSNPLESSIVIDVGLLRNSGGTWICGFSANLGTGSIIEAELWSLFRGLHMTWTKRTRSLYIEDCEVLLNRDRTLGMAEILIGSGSRP